MGPATGFDAYLHRGQVPSSQLHHSRGIPFYGWSDGDSVFSAGHVHGTLIVEIAARAVPHLGFFGPDDACLNTWLVELCNAVNGLAGLTGEYAFDEGEQGQPAFELARVGDEVAFSINASALGGGVADPEWQDVRFPYLDFRAAVQVFLDELRSELRQQAPSAWERWWPRAAYVRHGPPAAT